MEKIMSLKNTENTKKCEYCGTPYIFKEFKFNNNKGIWFPSCDCEEKIQQELEKKFEKLKAYKNLKQRYIESGIPPIFRGYRLKDVYKKGKTIRNGLNCEFVEDAQKYVTSFRPKKRQGFHFIGSVGNGKTTLAISIGKEILLKGYTVKFMTFAQCMRILQSTYSTKNNKNFDEQVKEFLKIDLLILDDFGRDGYKDQKLADAFEFLNTLYNYNSNVILTSNPEMIEKIKSIPDFGAMLDRLHKMSKCKFFQNKSYRREDK
jgi:DNA replication protein DnaC